MPSIPEEGTNLQNKEENERVIKENNERELHKRINKNPEFNLWNVEKLKKRYEDFETLIKSGYLN